MSTGKIQFAEQEGSFVLKFVGEVRLTLCSALDATIESDLRADLGVLADDFTSGQLERNYDRVAGAPNATIRYNATLGLCARQAKAKYLKLHDYRAGAVDEKLSQVQKAIDSLYALYEPDLNAALGRKKEVVRTALKATPHPERTQPYDGSPLTRPKNPAGI